MKRRTKCLRTQINRNPMKTTWRRMTKPSKSIIKRTGSCKLRVRAMEDWCDFDALLRIVKWDDVLITRSSDRMYEYMTSRIDWELLHGNVDSRTKWAIIILVLRLENLVRGFWRVVGRGILMLMTRSHRIGRKLTLVLAHWWKTNTPAFGLPTSWCKHHTNKTQCTAEIHDGKFRLRHMRNRDAFILQIDTIRAIDQLVYQLAAIASDLQLWPLSNSKSIWRTYK